MIKPFIFIDQFSTGCVTKYGTHFLNICLGAIFHDKHGSFLSLSDNVVYKRCEAWNKPLMEFQIIYLCYNLVLNMIPDVNVKPQSLLDKYLLDHVWNFWLLEFYGYQVLTKFWPILLSKNLLKLKPKIFLWTSTLVMSHLKLLRGENIIVLTIV